MSSDLVKIKRKLAKHGALIASKTVTASSGGGTSDHAALSNLDYAAAAHTGFSPDTHNHDAAYAPIAKGVTNGDSHDHNGGDGAQIDHTKLSNIGTNTHAQLDTAAGKAHDQNSDTALGSDAVAADHGTAATDMIVNVCYGTGEAPEANTTTEGTLWIKYTA